MMLLTSRKKNNVYTDVAQVKIFVNHQKEQWVENKGLFCVSQINFIFFIRYDIFACMPWYTIVHN